jgi:hypothetical protein
MEVLLFQEKNWQEKNWQEKNWPNKNRLCRRGLWPEKQQRRRLGWRCGVDESGFWRLPGAAAVAVAGALLHLVRMVQPFAVVSILFPVFRNFAVARTAPLRISSLVVD